MGPPVQFWFEFASTYSYPAAMRIQQVAEAAGATLEWKPFLLGPVFQERLGTMDSPYNTNPARGRYMWRDLERLCARYGLPWKKPSVFPRGSVLATRIACLIAGEPWVGDFVRAVYTANFAEDRDISQQETIEAILRGLGRDPALIQRAGAPEVKAQLRSNTEAALQIGIFGAPNFIVGGELFFGQDRMEDALAFQREARAP